MTPAQHPAHVWFDQPESERRPESVSERVLYAAVCVTEPHVVHIMLVTM